MPPVIVSAEPLAGLKEYLEKAEPFFIEVLASKGFWQSPSVIEKGTVPVIIGEKTRIPSDKLAAIRIIPTDWTPTWGASLIRFDQYSFYVDCMVLSTKASIVDEYTMVFSLAVAQKIIDIKNLQPEIPDTKQKAFDSWITSCQFGYSKGQAWRIARISYWEKMLHSYVRVTGDPCKC